MNNPTTPACRPRERRLLSSRAISPQFSRDQRLSAKLQHSHPPLSSRGPSLDLDQRSTDPPPPTSPPTSPPTTSLPPTSLPPTLPPTTNFNPLDSNHCLRIFHHLLDFCNEQHQSNNQTVLRCKYGLIAIPAQSPLIGTQLPDLPLPREIS